MALQQQQQQQQINRAEVSMSYWRSELAERACVRMKRGESSRNKRNRARAERRLGRLMCQA